MWRYIKGTAEHFKNHTNDIIAIVQTSTGKMSLSEEQMEKLEQCCNPQKHEIIAQRERVTSINDDRLARDMSRYTVILHDNNPVDLSTRYDYVNGMFLRATHGEWVKVNDSTYEKLKPLVTDNVNHPKHYTQGGIECIDAIKAATVGKSGIEAVCVANVVKYLWRYEEKNGVEDVKKARWYLERLIEEMGE